jgi:hypothetical protein
MAISLSDQELEVLYGQSHLILSAYVMAIRPRMDFKTGVVGIFPRISYQALSEWMYIAPRAGLKGAGSPSVSAIRRAIEQLKKIGLITSIGNAETLVFRLPFANTGNSVANKADKNPTGYPDTMEALRSNEFIKQADSPKVPKADTQQVSGLYINTTTVNNLVTTAKESPAVVVVSDLVFSNKLTPKEQTEILRIFAKEETPQESQQAILDEFAGASSTARGVSNAVGFIRALCQKAKTGEFTAEKANAIANARAKREIDQAARAEHVEKTVLQKAVVKKGALTGLLRKVQSERAAHV